MRKLSILLISILSICNLHAQQFTVSSNETVNKFFKELYVVSTNKDFTIDEWYINSIARRYTNPSSGNTYWGITFVRKGGSAALFKNVYETPESADILEWDLYEDGFGVAAKMYAVVDWTAIEEGTQFGTGRNIPLKYWDDLKFSPYISAYLSKYAIEADNVKFIDSNQYAEVFKELYIDSFENKIYHKEEGKSVNTYLEDIPLDKVNLQLMNISRKVTSQSSGRDYWGIVFSIKTPEYETRDGKNYIVRDSNGEVKYTRSENFYFNLFEERDGVIDEYLTYTLNLRETNDEVRTYTYRMRLYAVIDWSQIEEGTSVNFYPRNLLDTAYNIDNSPQIKEYIEEKESYLPIKVDAKATLNLTSSNRIMLYGASMCSNSYPWFKEWLEKYTGAEVFNAGNPGWSAKRVASTTYYDKVAQINPDVIYIMLGGNDKGDDVGTFGAISTQTLVEEIPLTESWSDAEANDKDYKFIQSLDYILRKLKSEYYDINDNPKDDKRFPYIVVGTFTPQHREGYEMMEYNDPQNWLNKRNAIVECANKNNIPCLDVFSEIGIDWDKEPYYNQDLDYVNGKPTLVNRGIYTLDGLHLNEYGFERLARLVSGVFVPSNSKIDSVEWSESSNLNYMTASGEYEIVGRREQGWQDNMPIISGGELHARLSVFATGGYISQFIRFDNIGVGDCNLYTRVCQYGVWGDWQKLQTNIEVNAIGVGQSKTFNDLTDNGIYSGVNVYWIDQANYLTSYETFVLVVINAYLTGGGISQLKYSTLVDGTTSVMTRREINGQWSEWKSVGGSENESILLSGAGTFQIDGDKYKTVFLASVGPGTGYYNITATKSTIIDVVLLDVAANYLHFDVNGSGRYTATKSYQAGMYRLAIDLSSRTLMVATINNDANVNKF